ncbi:NAD-P-binding protein [Trametes polyzona]|nr:NAD-P-binding protein [Trametes polyzona]
MASTARPTTWLVTGASRGIGLELVRQILQDQNNLVIAACRNPETASGLRKLKDTAKGSLHIVQLDVSDVDNIRALPRKVEPILGETGLDYLISNAGINALDTAFTLDPEVLLNVFRVNVVGPAVLSQVLLPYLEKGRTKKILHISSAAGSIGYAKDIMKDVQRLATYPISKAALNMLAYKQKVERPDFTVITLCPGWVKTDMGGPQGLLEPEESIAGILKVITSATLADSGKYLRYNGQELPW